MLRNTWPLSFMKRLAAHVFNWVAVSMFSMNADTGGWTNFTLRVVVPTGKLTNGNYVRLSLRSGNAEGLIISACYIGIKSGTYGFSTTPKQVTFDGGSAGFTVAAATTKMSDPITLPLTSSDSIVVSIHCPSGSTAADTFRRNTGEVSFSSYFKAGSDAANQSPSGYTTNAQHNYLEDLETST
jgi:hypothetical protein